MSVGKEESTPKKAQNAHRTTLEPRASCARTTLKPRTHAHGRARDTDAATRRPPSPPKRPPRARHCQESSRAV